MIIFTGASLTCLRLGRSKIVSK